MSLNRMRAGVIVAAMMVTAFALVGHAPPAAVADPVASATHATPDTHAWYTYYDDYFFDWSSCDARGEAMVNNPPSQGGVPGIIDYRCYLRGGDTKWSMDVYDTNAFS